MSFLAMVAAKVLEWLLALGGQYLYETTVEFIENQKKKKINKENTKEHKDDIAKNASPEKKGRSGADLINGNKSRH